MEKPATRPWDPAEYLQDEEDIQAFLEAVREEHDPGLSQDAREIIARARAMNQQREAEEKGTE